MRKKIVILFVCILFSSFFSILTTISQFTSLDTNYENFIKIGKIKKDTQPKELALNLYAIAGTKLKYRIDIPSPSNHSYDYLKPLSDSSYTTWANGIVQDIINITNSNTSPPTRHYLTTKDDKNYFEKNYIAFDSNDNNGFSSDKGFHLFVAIHNNAHIVNNPKKIKLSSDKLNFEANVSLKGNITGRVWNTNYKGDIDFYHNKYYVTHAYEYNKSKKTYTELKRGNWYFYNSADLIVCDLGITGDIEITQNRWKTTSPFSPKTHVIAQQMIIPFNSQTDTNAKVFKADYTITFTPSWNKNKKIKQSLFLGE